ncbi:hypothetical protein F5876DRAFT_83003 [Lentinula aff. lateritia]|uniref:Uncharacterized protein n=1 Tax=Lentinula aff. lateritia TaxID=2804960 RepID=A0ACC1TIG7_9AGAR|nr:hypothetical protein F5876DRAFT_83003 [Lentinula aff. lateritia]
MLLSLSLSLGWMGDWDLELGVHIVDVLLNKLRAISPSSPSNSSTSPSPPSSSPSLNSSQITSPSTLSVLTPFLVTLPTFLSLSDGQNYLQSVPKELDGDQAVILAFAKTPGRFGRVTVPELLSETGNKTGWTWTRQRAVAALDNMALWDGLCWVDEQDGEERVYWVTSAMKWDF